MIILTNLSSKINSQYFLNTIKSLINRGGILENLIINPIVINRMEKIELTMLIPNLYLFKN